MLTTRNSEAIRCRQPCATRREDYGSDFFYGGIAYYNPKSQSFRQIFSEDKSRTDVRSFHEDKQGNIWVGTSEGVYLIDCDSKTIKAHYNLENNLARCVLKDSEDQVW